MTFVLAAVRDDIASYVSAFFTVLSLLILAYIVLNLVFSFGGRVPYSRAFSAVFGFLRDVAEPILAPFRKVIPPLGPLDLSPIVALIVLRIVESILVSLIRG